MGCKEVDCGSVTSLAADFVTGNEEEASGEPDIGWLNRPAGCDSVEVTAMRVSSSLSPSSLALSRTKKCCTPSSAWCLAHSSTMSALLYTIVHAHRNFLPEPWSAAGGALLRGSPWAAPIRLVPSGAGPSPSRANAGVVTAGAAASWPAAVSALLRSSLEAPPELREPAESKAPPPSGASAAVVTAGWAAGWPAASLTASLGTSNTGGKPLAIAGSNAPFWDKAAAVSAGWNAAGCALAAASTLLAGSLAGSKAAVVRDARYAACLAIRCASAVSRG